MFRFRNWKVYNDARQLRLEVHRELLNKLPKEENFGLKSQIQRAVDSIILNIAEGAYRKSDKDFAHFLNQSMTSLYEFVSCLDLSLDSKYIERKSHEYFCSKAEDLAKQISAFGRKLRSTP